MRFPFVQVAQEAWPLSRELAALLGIHEQHARGLLADLWAWGTGLGAKDEAPTGICAGENAFRRLAGALLWAGDSAQLASALEEVGALEVLPGAVRVRGIRDRYARTWEKNSRSGHGKDSPGVNPAETRAGPGTFPALSRQKPAVSRAPDADADADAEKKHTPPPRARDLDKDDIQSLRAQAEKALAATRATGDSSAEAQALLIRIREAHREKVGTAPTTWGTGKILEWYVRVKGELGAGAADRLTAAHGAFLQDDYWAGQGWPWRGFAAQAVEFVAKAEARAHLEAVAEDNLCVVEGCLSEAPHTDDVGGVLCRGTHFLAWHNAWQEVGRPGAHESDDPRDWGAAHLAGWLRERDREGQPTG